MHRQTQRLALFKRPGIMSLSIIILYQFVYNFFNYTQIIIKMNREWKQPKAERVFHSNWLLAITRRLIELLNLQYLPVNARYLSMKGRECFWHITRPVNSTLADLSKFPTGVLPPPPTAHKDKNKDNVKIHIHTSLQEVE